MRKVSTETWNIEKNLWEAKVNYIWFECIDCHTENYLKSEEVTKRIPENTLLNIRGRFPRTQHDSSLVPSESVQLEELEIPF